LFAAVSIPSAVVVIGYFLAHRYDGLRLWNLQDQPWIVPVVWVGTAISFLFLYPATYNLLEIPAGAQTPGAALCHRDHPHQPPPPGRGPDPLVRHPPALDRQQLHGGRLPGADRPPPVCGLERGSAAAPAALATPSRQLKASTSVVPFRAVLDGRQQLVLAEFLRPAQLGIAIAVGVFWWAHRFIGVGATAFSRSALAHWLG
jgi:uncharacterized membrane protein